MPSATHPSGSTSKGVELAARAGYTAKGIVYAVIGVLAVQQAIGSGGAASSTREALLRIAQVPFGRILLGIVTLGLVAYVVWRLTQAIVDPEGRQKRDDKKRWAMRVFYLGSAVIYGLLAYSGAMLVLGSGDGSEGGSQGWAAELMGMSWGVWLVGAVGLGIIARGLYQFYKAYTDKFADKIQQHELRASQRRWAMRASRIGLTARGVIFAIAGTTIVQAAASHNPEGAQDMEGVLESMISTPWLLGAVGVGLIGYAVYQWVKARYRLIGV